MKHPAAPPTLFHLPQTDLPGIPLDRGYRLLRLADRHFALYRDAVLLRTVAFRDGFARRVFLVQMVREYGFSKTAIARATQVSRQTIDNCLGVAERWGYEGLVHGSKQPKRSTAPSGSKARILEQHRKQERAQKQDTQPALTFGQGTVPETFEATGEWQPCRFAGGFIYRAMLESGQLSGHLVKHLGAGAQTVWLFIMMIVQNIPSVEQLKVVVPEEFGLLLGLRRLPGKAGVWGLLTATYALGRGRALLGELARSQILRGIVAIRLVYLDGHFLPYTGKEPVRYAFNTQRRQTFPGRMAYVSRDASGRVVYFEIQEGPGDMLSAIQAVHGQIRSAEPEARPIIIADRELWGVATFLELDGADPPILFLTWERFTPKGDLERVDEKAFGKEFKVNGKRYRVTEQVRIYSDSEKRSIELRRIIIWNVTADCRVACVTNERSELAPDLARAMLGRWGISENGNKRLVEHLNGNYCPGYRIEEPSADQEVPNPGRRDLERTLSRKRKRRGRLAERLTRLRARQDPLTPKEAEKRDKLQQEFDGLEVEIARLGQELEACPERVPFAELRGVELKRIDEESRTLYELAQMSVFNAEKDLAQHLRAHYDDPRDPLVVLGMIARCDGWIRIDGDAVRVRLAPLHRPTYLAAQRGLVARLNALSVYVAPGKRLVLEVGEAPSNPR